MPSTEVPHIEVSSYCRFALLYDHMCKGQDCLQVLSTALVKAERENATVYLQRVPNFADLPPIQPYILVKSLPLTDVDASQESLFQSVIPDSRYLLVSLMFSATCSPLPLCKQASCHTACNLHSTHSSVLVTHSLTFLKAGMLYTDMQPIHRSSLY